MWVIVVQVGWVSCNGRVYFGVFSRGKELCNRGVGVREKGVHNVFGELGSYEFRVGAFDIDEVFIEGGCY